jgi:DNA-binding NtrC family response regulator
VFDKGLAAAPSPSSKREDHAPAGAIEIKGKNWAGIEAAILAAVMASVGGSRTEACRVLEIDHKRLLRMLREYNLEAVASAAGQTGPTAVQDAPDGGGNAG